MEQKKAQESAKTEDVRLLIDGHKHRGVERKKGDVITVTQAQAKRLVDEKKIAERHVGK